MHNPVQLVALLPWISHCRTLCSHMCSILTMILSLMAAVASQRRVTRQAELHASGTLVAIADWLLLSMFVESVCTVL